MVVSLQPPLSIVNIDKPRDGEYASDCSGSYCSLYTDTRTNAIADALALGWNAKEDRLPACEVTGRCTTCTTTLVRAGVMVVGSKSQVGPFREIHEPVTIHSIPTHVVHV
jgi:hypothetical protein